MMLGKDFTNQTPYAGHPDKNGNSISASLCENLLKFDDDLTVIAWKNINNQFV